MGVHICAYNYRHKYNYQQKLLMGGTFYARETLITDRKSSVSGSNHHHNFLNGRLNVTAYVIRHAANLEYHSDCG